MDKRTKIWLVIAALLVAAGLILFGVVMTGYRWDFTKLGTVNYETNTYEIGAPFSSIFMDTDTADIAFALSEDGKCRVVCYEEEYLKHSVAVRDHTLMVETVDERTPADFAGYIGIHFGSPKITVYLPKTQYESLMIRENTGDVTIPAGFTFANVEISLSTGDISVEGLSVDALDLTVTTGDVALTDITCRNFTSTGNTGDLELENMVAAEEIFVERTTGDVELDHCNAGKISVLTDTGDVEFDSCDGVELTVQTDTGDVSGSLLTQKIFETHTDTGDVKVPHSTTGGICRITTDTGDISITIAK